MTVRFFLLMTVIVVIGNAIRTMVVVLLKPINDDVVDTETPLTLRSCGRYWR